MKYRTMWGYRKYHVINPASGAGTNYQIRIKVHYGSGTDGGENVYLGGKCRTDFGDVRLVASDGIKLLDYWIEEKVDSNYAIFWVEVADDLSTNPATIYCMYGKSDATTTKNGDNTFLFFDDFETDLSKWVGTGTYGLSTDYAYEGSKSARTGTGISNIYKTVALSNVAVHVRFRDTQDVSVGNVRGVLTANGSSVTSQVGVYSPTSKDYYVYRIGDTFYASNVARTLAWHSFIIRCKPNVKQFLIDDSLQPNTGSENSVVIVQLGSVWEYNYNLISYWDACFVRKWVDPEPSHGAWGSEETLL
jgi:hypothetical protein